ncbi:uncharacterized protein LOC114292392 [Camellia sinensis]|uniref:uncharacterized protein LOC114292392 n=1 Tax=Camellia sinensis TaxID=4442 RepID=UPI0010367E93|nr:uncharacterized protein LOC114292392 [Camellia sinensis]
MYCHRIFPYVEHNQDALSDEDIPDNRSFIHRRYHNCARNFHESERFQRMQFPAPTTYRHCNARLFHRETSTMCCNNGTIVLPPVTAPNEMIDIFFDQTVEGRHFRQHIRAYNHVFSFTSMGVHVDENLATRTRDVYTFRAQGAIYHKIGSLLPNSSDRPRYLQLYVYDTNHENENRMSENEELHLDLLDKIKNILNAHNPFVHTFRQLAQRPDIHECRLQIKEQLRNGPQYDLPTTPEVASVLVDGKEVRNLKPRDIIVQSTSGHLLNIADIVGYYDPLQYPLLLPYGSYGWDTNTKSNDGRTVTCDFYSYMLQIRPGDKSLFLRGGCLLQQYVVDNYVKIESNKLRWIHTHQNHIRADFYQGLLDAVHVGENYGGNVGRRTILPSSFVGSTRDMYQRYQDAMALIQKYGKPDLFLTMTCNPNWPEIKVELLPGYSVTSVKYLYKYVYKGPDRVALEVRQGPNYDEVQHFIEFINGRWVCALEALWKTFKFPMTKMTPSVECLQIHLLNKQQVRFYTFQDITNVLGDEYYSRTMLTQFFQLNVDNETVNRYLYREIPQHHRWCNNAKIWQLRLNHQRVIGRIYTVSPLEGERFYLRILLNHIRGPKSFDHLLMVNGIAYPTFKQATEHHGVRSLWDEIYPCLIEDYISSNSMNNMYILNKTLQDINCLLLQHNKNISEYNLPEMTMNLDDNSTVPKVIQDELVIVTPREDLNSIATLNSDQHLAFNSIMEAVECNTGAIFFVDGPGGTGKTYLYRALLASVRSQGRIAIATATFGIAATLLPGGRTAHSRFKISLNLEASSVCSITKQSDLAELIRRETVILWDEATMTNRYAFEALNRTLIHITGVDYPFGGKIMVFGGDFRQVLPVVPKGTKAETIAASIVKSPLWSHIQILRLKQNMRSINDQQFGEFLLSVGNGVQPTIIDEMIKVPTSMAIPWNGEESIV